MSRLAPILIASFLLAAPPIASAAEVNFRVAIQGAGTVRAEHWADESPTGDTGVCTSPRTTSEQAVGQTCTVIVGSVTQSRSEVLEPVAPPGWRFAGWEGAPCAGQPGRCTVELVLCLSIRCLSLPAADSTIRARFTDDVAPLTEITDGPARAVVDPHGRATFAFNAAPPEQAAERPAFRCSLDGAAWSPCTSPAAYHGLGRGVHEFCVKATDPSQNAGPVACRTWQLQHDPDADGDGHSGQLDCDDANPLRHRSMMELLNNGVDDDCDGVAAEDRDGDGYLAGAGPGRDCDDSDRARHPGAADVPGDGIAQNCVADGPPPQLPTALTYKYKRAPSGIVLTKLRLTAVPAGGAVRVTCRGRRPACPFERWSPRAKGSKLGLLARFERRVLKPRTRIRIAVTAPRTVGKAWTLTTTKRELRAPVGCLPPGAVEPESCTTG